MSSNTINCDKFKDAYMKCVDEKIVSRIKKFDISLDLGESCNEPFQVRFYFISSLY